jgi:dihydrofolate reductase
LSNLSKVRVYIACSLDGFIAGSGDDLSWLPQGDDTEDGDQPAEKVDDGVIEFPEFMSGVGAVLMGRRTYDVASGMTDELPYGAVPLLVATNRPLDNPGPTVRTVQGTISEIAEEARSIADGKDVYVDGGNLIRQALDAGEVDDLIITVVPRLLGEGVPLFAGVTQRHSLTFTGHYRYGSMIQIHARPTPPEKN